jgi:prepilin-type N-terminal cleavage/methylation domain-containing protein
MKKGFTLIELLIVIAIIAIIAGAVLVAINPAKRIGEANDSQRWSEVNSIASAISQFIVDNAGVPPLCDDDGAGGGGDIPTAAVFMCEGCSEDGSAGCDGADADDEDECDLDILVTQGYLTSIAADPTATSTDITGYKIDKDTANKVCVYAPYKYGASEIKVCR